MLALGWAFSNLEVGTRAIHQNTDLCSTPCSSRWRTFVSETLHTIISHHGQAFMLKRAAEERLGHATAIITDVLENAEMNRLITTSQKRALLQEMALKLSSSVPDIRKSLLVCAALPDAVMTIKFLYAMSIQVQQLFSKLIVFLITPCLFPQYC
ncbi:uncharacterized protein LOC120113237 [Phoenix dactylifera]|uniref:Uncharacterized protein LOC120113237 n=1 Tax=Phoenix dactylifera TaxID=42345 RepID=A0A8B9AU30_PHODC|nr:uncharacterized protein LOC120113237 [Phoenix dactylifera]